MHHAAGALAVVGILLEADSVRDSQLWCSALEQALALIPAKVGAVSGGFGSTQSLAHVPHSPCKVAPLPVNGSNAGLCGLARPQIQPLVNSE